MIDLIIQNVCERTDGNGVVMVLELASQSKKQCAIESAYHKRSLTYCDWCFDTLRSSKMQS